MSKYSRLTQYLKTSCQARLNLSFLEIERILGFKLPKSAYSYGAWWANGGHSQSDAWLGAGCKVERVDLNALKVYFRRSATTLNQPSPPKHELEDIAVSVQANSMPGNSAAKTMTVCGYEFQYLQQIIPECDTCGRILKYFPQDAYENKRNLKLSQHGNGAFCHFTINTGDWPGVYLWIVDNRIIYIGETDGLKRRFNLGYGNISPRNCFVGGQSTNCKMNKVVLNLFELGKVVSIYFYKTTNHRHVENELLSKIVTPYNVKNN